MLCWARKLGLGKRIGCGSPLAGRCLPREDKSAGVSASELSFHRLGKFIRLNRGRPVICPPPWRGSMSRISSPETSPAATPTRGPGCRIHKTCNLSPSHVASLNPCGVAGRLSARQGKHGSPCSPSVSADLRVIEERGRLIALTR